MDLYGLRKFLIRTGTAFPSMLNVKKNPVAEEIVFWLCDWTKVAQSNILSAGELIISLNSFLVSTRHGSACNQSIGDSEKKINRRRG